MNTTLTRDQALDLVEDCKTLQDCIALQHHWIGHGHYLHEDTAETLRERLREYVEACAFNGDDERSNGPKGTDDTGLSAP